MSENGEQGADSSEGRGQWTLMLRGQDGNDADSVVEVADDSGSEEEKQNLPELTKFWRVLSGAAGAATETYAQSRYSECGGREIVFGHESGQDSHEELAGERELAPLPRVWCAVTL